MSLNRVDKNFLPQYIEKTESFVSTEGQNTFVLNQLTFTPDAEQVSVFITGVRQQNKINFIELNNKTIRLAEALNAGEAVDIVVKELKLPNTNHAGTHKKGSPDALNIKDLLGYEIFLVQNFGSNFAVGGASWSWTNAQIDAEIDLLALVKPRPILLVFHVRDDSGTLKIVQHGFTGLNHSEAHVDYAVNQLISRGFTIYGIKVHATNSDNMNSPFSSQFMTDYRALINQLATKYQGDAEYFFVTNEAPTITGEATHTAALQQIILDVKAKGFKAASSMVSIDELINCTVMNELDAYGINSYPKIGTNGLNTKQSGVVSGWGRSRILETFSDLKKKYPTKKTFITETGCTDKLISLEYPAYWNVGSYPDNDGKIMSIYWDGTFKALKDFQDIDMIFGWDAGIYSPYQFTTSLDAIKKWVGE